MGFIIRWLRKLRREYLAPEFMGVRYLRATYEQLLRYVAWIYRRGIPVNIGGYGYFRIEPSLVFGKYNYEDWGANMNNGFKDWVESCKGKAVVFDIGAHIGLYSLPASKYLHPKGCLYAFEPGEENCAVFQKHLQYNNIKNIRLCSCLVGGEDKQNITFFEREGEVEGANSILLPKNPNHFIKTFKEQVTMDCFCQHENILPEVMKIDVEGAEINVLKGAREILNKCHPIIFLSIHPKHLEALGQSVRELRDLIANLGYTVYNTEGNAVKDFMLKEYILRH